MKCSQTHVSWFLTLKFPQTTNHLIHKAALSNIVFIISMQSNQCKLFFWQDIGCVAAYWQTLWNLFYTQCDIKSCIFSENNLVIISASP